MIYWLYELLKEDHEALVRVLRYVSSRSLAAALFAFLISLVMGPWVVRKLLSLKMGQPIRTAEDMRELAEIHGRKQGTPTMGGVMILAAVVTSTLLFARLTNPFIWLCLIVTIVLGSLGFLDDYKKVTMKSSDGVSARFKMSVQAFLAVGVTAFLIFYQHPEHEGIMTTLFLPLLNVDNPFSNVQLGWFAVILFGGVIVGCSNAVNLTDGLDGLAIGCTIVTAATYAIFNYIAGRADWASDYLFIPHHPWSTEVTVFCMAIVGAGMGFLWFNSYPASVFMGDTGSLAIGGMLGTVAICCKQEITLVIVGGVFVMEALSVMLQVGSFKLRRKRIFKMAPIHHHFELKGWSETKIIIRFWILALLCAGLGLASLKLRY
ncbi:MAG: phospho-N-acetylmuramoyl-pentapeptide-transferase [Verrucomicrobiales bacterium]|jgi:phospho-N-acetylmuramoyl-pentapeptide-transferase|nr:phospho-N-acetylmuramoyl-pentapeptide-transferase [Verrucomicrobiales bacterium]MDB2327400.1 phospho-N-acetylmuramoyl-pentapeptide-transferase [bacterium]NCF84323.1 phospho-N-acetylmuramoyl-pentapeptide-transferase [Verrucomicrobiaceae bacterium]